MMKSNRFVIRLLSVVLAFAILLPTAALYVSAADSFLSAVPTFKLTVVNTNSVQIDWSAVSTAQGYYVFRKSTQSGSWSKIADAGNAVSYTDKTCTEGKTYYYTVRAYKKVNGVLKYSSYNKNGVGIKVSFTAIVPKFTAAAIDIAVVRVSWGSILTSSGYRVYRKLGSVGKWEAIAVVKGGSVTSYTDKSCLENKTYYYTVKAYKSSSAGNIYTSNNKTGISVETGFAKFVPVVSVQTTNVSQINVKWQSVSSASGYVVYRSSSPQESWTKIKTVNNKTLNCTDSGLNSSTKYYYMVKAYKSTTSGDVFTSYNNIGVSATPSFGNTVPIVKAVSSGTTSVKVSWNKITGADGFLVYRKASSSGSWSKVKTISNGTTVSYNDTGLTEGKTYYYTVKAYDGSADKGPYTKYNNTGVAAAVVFANAEITVTGIKCDGSIDISWNKISGASGYVVYCKVGSGSWVKAKTISSASTVTYSKTDCVEGKTYYFTVKAYRTVSGKTTYTPSGTAACVKYVFEEPSFDVIMDNITINNVKYIAFDIENKGSKPMEIYYQGIMSEDIGKIESLSLTNFISSAVLLKLIDYDKYINNNEKVYIDSYEVPAGKTETVCFAVAKSGVTYSNMSAIFFLFKYDCKSYACAGNCQAYTYDELTV